MIPKCYLCNEELSGDNITNEHIIPESIGGSITSNKLICSVCNKTTGHLFDAEFAKLGGFLAIQYKINLSKSKFQATEVGTGARLKITSGFKVSRLEPVINKSNNPVWVQHPDKKRAIEELRRIVKELNDPDFEVKNIYFETIKSEEDKKIDFIYDRDIEPGLLLRSVCKTVINFYLFRSGNPEDCSPLINYLKQETGVNHCWFLDLNISKTHFTESINHILLVRGERKNKMLYAYFEMFGETGFLVLINGQYKGSDLNLDYTYDPRRKTEIAHTYEFKLKTSEIIDYLIAKPDTAMLKSIHHHFDYDDR